MSEVTLDVSIDLNFFAQGAPSYISSLAAFAVASVSSTVSGHNTMSSVTPASWNPGSVGAISDNIMTHWSGGFMVVTNTSMKLPVHGGGHSDCACNGLYEYDFSGTTQPQGWSLIEVSATSAVAPDTYSDSRPVSVHTYGGACEINGIYFRTGGSSYNQGSMIPEFWRFDPAAAGPNRWAKLPNAPFGAGGACVANTAASTFGKILFGGRFVDAGAPYAFFTFSNAARSAGSWSARKDIGNQFQYDPCFAYRPTTTTTGTLLNIGGDGASSFTVDWAAETVSGQTSRTIPNLGRGGGLVCYDPDKDVFWYLSSNSPYTTLYEINPTTWGTTAHTLTGATAITNSEANSEWGWFGRAILMRQYRALGLVAARNGNAFVIRLP